MRFWRRKAQEGLCAICERPFERGDRVQTLALFGYERPIHAKCYDEDLEAGLELFPPPLQESDR